MGLPPLVSPVELTRRLPSGELIEDTDRVAAAVEDASTLVRDEAGATWVDDTGSLTAVPDVVRMITLEVARRALNRSFLFGAEGDDRDTGLFLRADEKRRLNAVTGETGTKPALWTLPTTRGDEPDVDYRPVEGGGDPLPWGYQGPTPWAAP